MVSKQKGSRFFIPTFRLLGEEYYTYFIMEGMTMMQNGQFFTAGDDGQIRPVSEVLKIRCGRDFEKCARWNTIFVS